MVRIRADVAAKLYERITIAGYRDQFLAAIGASDSQLRSTLRADAPILDRSTLNAITSFVQSKPDLWNDPAVRAMVNCDPSDPFSICG